MTTAATTAGAGGRGSTDERLAVVLVGHGASASDTPRKLVRELRQLARRREERGEARGDRERELDRRVRGWPRTPDTDPYGHGVERLADALRRQLRPIPVVVAFNELAHPSTDDAIDRLVADGFQRLVLVSTMLTPGGRHAEIDIPETVARARRRHPTLRIDYLWPFDLDRLAGCLASAVRDHLGRS